MRKSETARGSPAMRPAITVLVDLTSAISKTGYIASDLSPGWAAADTEIKLISDENRELKGSPFKT